MPGLTPKQLRFIDEYLVDANATAAYQRAGYTAKHQSAKVEASKLLRDPRVAAIVKARQAERAEKVGITAERVVDELSHLGLYDAGELGAFPMKGPEDIAVLPERLRRAVIGWSWDKQGRFTIKLSPKTPSLELLGRHLGMFKDGPAGGGVTQVTVYLPDNGRK